MDRINGLKALGFAGMIALGATFAVSSAVFAEDAKKEAPKKETKEAGKEGKGKKGGAAMGMVFSQWAKDLGLDEATQAKLAEIHAKQEEATKEKSAKMMELTKAAKDDTAAGKKDDAKTKSEEAAKIKAEIMKSNTEFKAQAFAVLTPEQQKKIGAQLAYKNVVMTSPFKQVTLTADQQKKILEKLETSGDLLNDQKEVDSKKLAPITKALADEILTADQKAVVATQAEENKGKAAAAKKDAAKDGAAVAPAPKKEGHEKK